MSEIKLSVIIPVYNVERYLLECVNSFDMPLSAGYEIVLVDDGSTDSSGTLCDKILRDMGLGITVIHQGNGGLSAARNRGVEAAKGKYIAFVDSDDRIAGGSLTKILEWTDSTEADICFMRAEKFYPDGEREDIGENILFTAVHHQNRYAVMEHIASRPKFPGSACTKLFRRAFLEENHLRFPGDRRHSEDLGFIRDSLLAAQNFDMLDVPYYEYRQNRENSITNSITSKTFWDMSLFVEESEKILMPDGKCFDTINKLAMSFVAYEYAIMLWRYRWLNHTEAPKAMRWLSKHKYILLYGKSKISRSIYFLSKIIGLRGTSFMLDLYKTRSIKTVFLRKMGGGGKPHR